MADKTVKVTDDNFENIVLKSDKPVLVDFWASWCHPCSVMGPIIEELATKNSGKTLIAKVNVDDNPKTADEYKVMSIPTYIVFEKGKPVKTAFGSMNEQTLVDTFGKWLK